MTRKGQTRRSKGPYWVGWLINDVMQALDGHDDESLGYWLDQIAQGVQSRNWYTVSLALARANATRHKLRSAVLQYQVSADIEQPPVGEDDGNEEANGAEQLA